MGGRSGRRRERRGPGGVEHLAIDCANQQAVGLRRLATGRRLSNEEMCRALERVVAVAVDLPAAIPAEERLAGHIGDHQPHPRVDTVGSLRARKDVEALGERRDGSRRVRGRLPRIEDGERVAFHVEHGARREERVGERRR